jgi:uncharacterized phage protein (TIGR01671 family)
MFVNKFRSFIESINVMSEPFTLADLGEYAGDTIQDGRVNPQLAHIMQCTGLKDVEGRDIYQGDILRITHGNRKFSAVVNYTLSYMGYSLGNPKNTLELAKYDNGKYINRPALYHHVEWGWGHSPRLLVIGNIYQNPELTK